MEKATRNIIDIFVSVVDNYGDMGFACEFVQAMQCYYPHQFEYGLWTDNATSLDIFIRQFHLSDIIIGDIGDFGKLRKSAIGISILHAKLPELNLFQEQAIILRIDYLSFDSSWISNNEGFHISSTENRQIIELIPSPLSTGAGLLPIVSKQSDVGNFQDPHITIFAYRDSLEHINFDSFPDDITIYIFGKAHIQKKNIIFLDVLEAHLFYHLLDTSEFVIIRGEVSFAHVLQSGVPFLWDIYKGIGGFPEEQSEQFLDFIQAKVDYRELHQILNSQKIGKIDYLDIQEALSDTGFGSFQIQNLIHAIKKYIDRFNNSI